MRYLLVLLSVLSLSLSLLAQEKVNNNDLREEKLVLKIESSTNESYELRRDQQEQYSLKSLIDKKAQRRKLSKDFFSRFDSEFVRHFISMKYMQASDNKKCTQEFLLFMRGEELKICKSEKSKIKTVRALIKKLL